MALAFKAAQRNHLRAAAQSLVRHSSKAAEVPQCTAPILFTVTPSGEENEISEEDLYKYTRHRCREKAELSKRYLKFDIQQLVDSAVQLLGKEAQYCISVHKLSEGLHNKTLLLRMNTGTEVIARLPNPNAGPAFYTVASEVATRDLLREHFGIPIPRVLKWSSTNQNPVGAEYILEEKAHGVPLGKVWYSWPRKSKLGLIAQIVDLEKALSSLQLSKQGGIYFREDLPGESLDSLVLHPSGANKDLSKYTMGPLATSELWDNGRQSMKLSQGPWGSSLEYMKDIGQNERSWTYSHAKPRMAYYRYLVAPEDPGELVSLLSKYEELVPFLVPSTRRNIHFSTLWHPDLHLNNIFVDPETEKITAILDWQSAVAAPIYLQSVVPKLFRHPTPVQLDWSVPKLPDDYENLDANGKRQADSLLEGEVCHKYYYYQTFKNNADKWTAVTYPHLPILIKPVWLATNAWANQDIFFFRDALMEIVDTWDTILPAAGPCPNAFSEEERALHAKEEENVEGVGTILKLFRDESVLPVDCMVDPDIYDEAKQQSEYFKTEFLNLAESEDQRALFEKLWPYQDLEQPSSS